MESVFTIRLTNELKAEMQKFDHVNWSELVRESIKNKIARLKMKKATKTIDSLQGETRKLPDGTIVEWIREMRERR